MSRSYRKPYVKDGYGSKRKPWMKSYSNRKIRRKLKNPDYEIPDGMGYKNGPGLNRWDICDYRWFTYKPVKPYPGKSYGHHAMYRPMRCKCGCNEVFMCKICYEDYNEDMKRYLKCVRK